MAQGYIKLSDPSHCTDWECFTDLLWRSFFQDVSEDELGNIKWCKMHDLMHDLASSVAGAESVCVNLNLREFGMKTRHISFDQKQGQLASSSICA
uniref:Putative disease resistance protein RGA3 n=1 Tax=Rhizophora mucronata TaxID=61149 RepID=A0A2P2MWZ0_RHIMU